MSWKTQSGPRPDLAAIEVNWPTGYHSPKILPVRSMMEKAGAVTYQTLAADSAAQTGRSAGTGPTAVMLASSSAAVACAEKIKRYGLDKGEVKQVGGVANCDAIGARASKRSVMRKLEGDCADLLINVTTYAAAGSASGGLYPAIEAAAKAIKRYKGALTLLCSETAYQAMIADSETTDKMAFALPAMNKMGIDLSDVVSINQNVVKAILQGLYAFENVLVADDDHWKITHYEDAIVVLKAPPVEMFAEKLDPILGLNFTYLPDGTNPWEIESFASDQDKANYYDASVTCEMKILNSGAFKLVKGVGTATT
jgi:hypothetical protein